MESLTQEVGRRRRLGVVAGLCGAMLVGPLLCLRTAPHQSRPDRVSVWAGGDVDLMSRDLPRALAVVYRANLGAFADNSVGQNPPLDVVAVPVRTAVRTAASVVGSRARATASRPTATTRTRTSTVTRPPPPPPRPTHSQTGQASWYDATAGTCASRSAPYGTIVRVTNLATGASTTCRVADYGPTAAGRIIDLSRTTFAQIANPAQGVIQVRVDWS